MKTIKNKTGYTQKIYLKGGSTKTARPFRTITLDEQVSGLDSNIWEVQGENKPKKANKQEIGD